MKRFTASFSLAELYPHKRFPELKSGAERAWISWGDYKLWHIGVLRDAILARYGEAAVSPMQTNREGYAYFEYDDAVDLDVIAEDIGVSHSSPSSSSSCSK